MDGDTPSVGCALPPEILVHILSFVADGRTLLDAVPLVCRRWHQLGLSRDSAAWRSVRLRCRADDEDAARVLLHAPALHSLELEGDEPPSGELPAPRAAASSASTRCRLRSALRRSRAPLRELRMGRGAWKCVGGSALTALVWRHRHHLRVLQTYLEPPTAAGEDLSDTGEAPTSLLDAIGQQRRLVSLAIDCESDMPWPTYKGELSAGPCGLRELRVSALAGPVAALNDVLCVSAPSVEVLDVVDVSYNDLVFLRVGALARLRDLGLRLHLFDDGYADEEAPQMVSKAISEASSVPGLRRLRLEMHNGHFVRSAVVVDQCNQLVDGFRSIAPTVEVDFTFWRLFDADNDE